MNLSKQNIIALVFLTVLSLCIGYISGFTGVISLWVGLIIYGFIFYVLHIIWRYIRGKEISSIKDFYLRFLGKVSLGIIIAFTVIGGFAYYQNTIHPAEIPLYTLSNGSKQVQFQGMSHIGSKDFYEEVKDSIKIAKQDGFILFYEGVRPGSQENINEFNEAIGIEFNADLYENFSKLYGVDHQKNPDFLGIENDKDFNIDLDIDEIMSIYRKKIGTNQTDMPDMPDRGEKQVADVGKDIIDQLSDLSERELSLLRYINKSVLNFIVKNSEFRDMMLATFGNEDLFSVILEERNIYLVESITSSEYSNIFVMYGLMHFDGVLELLQKKDPKWSIQSIEYKQLIN